MTRACNFLLFALVGLHASSPASAQALPLNQRVVDLVERYEQSSKGNCGVSVIDLRTGENLVEIRPDELFVPASNQKLLTSAFALARLGGDFQFTTCVYRLADDLVIVGDGDPTLGDPRLAKISGKSIYTELDRWAAAIKQNAGAVLRGDILLCSRFKLESFRCGDWPERQRHRWYAGPVADLNFHNNCFDVTFTVAAEGTVTPHVLPESGFIRILSRVKRGKRHVWSLQSNDDDSQVKLRGTVKRSTKEPLSVPANHPPMLLGRVLAGRLVRAGVELTGSVRTVQMDELDLTKGKMLARTTTPLSVAMRRANVWSLNMAAECIFLRAGDGTWEGSAKMMEQVLAKHYGLKSDSLVVRDGGGLSRANRVSPRALSLLLARVSRRADSDIFLSSLPRSGLEGTLRARLAETPYRGRLLAKTGYVAGASNLSGYVLDGENRLALGFAILVNRVPSGKAYRAKQLQDSIARLLVDSLDGR